MRTCSDNLLASTAVQIRLVNKLIAYPYAARSLTARGVATLGLGARAPPPPRQISGAPTKNIMLNVNQTDKGKRVPSQNSKAPCPSIHWKNPIATLFTADSLSTLFNIALGISKRSDTLLKSQNALTGA